MLNCVLRSFYVSMVTPSVILAVTSAMPASIQKQVTTSIFPLISYFDPFEFFFQEFDFHGNILFGFFRFYVSTSMTLFLLFLGFILVSSLVVWSVDNFMTDRRK